MTGLAGRLLGYVGAHATTVLFLGVFLGLAWPGLAALCRPLLAPAVGLLLFATLLRMDWPGLARYARRPLFMLAGVLWLLIVSPVLVYLLLAPLPLPESLTVAIVLMAAAPPILSAAAIAMVVGLDGPLALVASLASTLLTPIILPPLAFLLLGIDLEIGLGTFMLRLGVLVGGAFAAALVVRRWVGAPRLAALAQPLDGAIMLLMLVFAVAIMDGVTARLLNEPAKVGLWLLAAFLANPLLQIAGAAAFARLGRRPALTAGLISGNRNMGLLLATLPAEGNFDVVLYFAVAQLPMYMLPALLRRLYRRIAPDRST